MARKIPVKTTEVTYQCSCGRKIFIQIVQNISIKEIATAKEPVHKPTQKQMREQRVRVLADRFTMNHDERQLRRALKENEITIEEFEWMKKEVSKANE